MGSEFTKSIEMFVTITSSKDALITSHMGITVSAESIAKREKRTSVDLHSFAAKVMLMRKPERKYMVNSPVFAMANIIANALPDHVHYGTREMRKTLQNAQGIGQNEYAHTTNGDDNETIIESLRKKITRKANIDVARRNELLKKELLGKEGDQVKHIIEEKYKMFNIFDDYGEINPKNEIVVSSEKIELILNRQLEQEYYFFKNPYIFPLAERDNRGIELLKYMELHPPVISATQPNGKKEFSIFDSKKPSKVWLSIDEENSDVYDWMFRSSFGQLGKTYYMAVDLNALANCRHLISESKI